MTVEIATAEGPAVVTVWGNVLLREIFVLDDATGILTWLSRPRSLFADDRAMAIWTTRFLHKAALMCMDGNGYRHGTVFGKNHYAHRVVFALSSGHWPAGLVDHIDGDKTNNRPANLRDVGKSGNAKNAKMYSRNTSGVTGVHWYARKAKWFASIRSEGKLHHLGYFESLDDAVMARSNAEANLGFTHRHGK